MDDIVAAALRKWPNVPDCRGWLALDARGDWYLRDQHTQAAGTFAQSKGSRVEHAGLREFIERNYASDAAGAWYFQNGPQRVYVELEAAPWVWRLAAQRDTDGRLTGVGLHSHSGQLAAWRSTWLDESGRLFLATDLGFGLVHTLDMETAADAIDGGLWPVPGEARFAELQQRFGFTLSPASEAARNTNGP
jgi:hypothetical protein